MNDYNKCTVFYHFPCNDGEVAKMIWKRRFPDSTLFPWNHTEKDLSFVKLNELEDTMVVFLDICPQIELLPIKHKYLIIDHHMNAIDCMKKATEFKMYDITMHCDTSLAGCMLTWEFCYHDITYPNVVHHIGNKDIWNFDDIDTEAYSLGYTEYLKNFKGNERDNIIIKLLNNNNMLNDNILELGIHKKTENINKYIMFFNKSIIVRESIEDDEYTFIDIECDDSMMYKYIIDYCIDNTDCDILRILHTRNVDSDVYSLRSLRNHITVDQIARKYGGNGHPKAAGYMVKK